MYLKGAECEVDGDCDDGLYCNGAEFCQNGLCLSSDSIDCGLGFNCDEDNDECVVDCDSFDIDGYLNCSSSFSDVEVEIESLDDRLTTNEEAIDDINKEIRKLKRKCNQKSSDDRRGGGNSRGRGGKRSSISNGVSSDFMDTSELSVKDVLIVGLLLGNIGLMIHMCCSNTKKGVRYSKVPQVASDSES